MTDLQAKLEMLEDLVGNADTPEEHDQWTEELIALRREIAEAEESEVR